MSKETELQAIHAEALQEHNRAYTAMRDERTQCLQDRRFYSIPGAQWEGEYGAQFENKPKIEINKVHLSVIRIINEYRENRITANFEPRDGSDDEVSEMCDMLFRADEQDSVAEEAYDNAFEEAVGGGFGAFRLRTCYENEYDPEDERQRIRFEPVFDADTSVYFDLDAKRQDKSDATKGWVVYSMTHEAYKEEYGEDPASWPKDDRGLQFDWNTPDVVYLAEYYRVEETREKWVYYITLDGNEVKYLEDQIDEEEVERLGAVEYKRRSIPSRQVHKYIMDGNRILEDCGVIAGKCIPIIPVYGKRWFIDNIERCMGHVRLAKDAQRLKNMVVSWLAHIASVSPLRKPIFAPEQIAGHEAVWRDANLQEYPYLLANPITDAEGNPIGGPAPQAYSDPPTIPQAIVALAQQLDFDLQELLGNPQAADRMVSNISAQAVEMIQKRVDMLAAIYMTNFAKAQRRAGEVWLSMAEDIYVEPGRRMKGVGPQGNIETIELGKQIVDMETGRTRDATNLAKASLDVTVDVGPSFQSARDAAISALSSYLPAITDPALKSAAEHALLMNIEGEGVGMLRDFARKSAVAQGIEEPNDEERKAMEAAANQPSEPDPQSVYLLSEAEKNEAETMNKVADAEYTAARTEHERLKARETEAKTIETLDKIGKQNV